MSAPAPTTPPVTPPPSGRPPGSSRWTALLAPLAAGLSVLLAGAATGDVVGGTGWIWHAIVSVALVVVVGTVLVQVRPWLAAPGQLVALILLATAWFTDSGVGTVLPGPTALRQLSALLGGAGQQINTGVPPVASTPEILLLITLGFGTLAIAVFGLAVTVDAPAAGGVPLLVVFAVPAALQPELLPWWSLVAAAAGYGLLLLLRPDRLRQAPGGVAVVAVAVAGALLCGVAASAVGTAGRFGAVGGAGGGADGSIGLNPFTSLHGQLTRSEPRDLFRVSGLEQETYLRALTLQTYVPQEGWKAERPAPGVALTGQLPPSTTGPAVQQQVQVENLGFHDFWMPMFGDPVRFGLAPDSASAWTYDAGAGIGYSERPRSEDGWSEAMRLPQPSADQLRSATGPITISRTYTDTDGLDPRVAKIARDVTKNAPTAFDKAMALENHFTGPGSPFTYSLATAPGSGGDALYDFLTHGRTGYCEQYASAMAIMLRAVDVPARVAVGFTAGDDGPDGRTITTKDAHAWVEAWFPGYGWMTFDPTPLADGRTIEPSYVSEAQEQAGGTPAQQQPAPPEPAQQPQAGQDQATPPEPPVPGEDQQQPSPVADSWLLPTLGGILLLVALMLVVVAPGLWRRRQYSRRTALARTGGSGAAYAAWDEVLAASCDHGVPVPAGDTVRGAAARMIEQHGLTGRPAEALDELAERVERSWYGGILPEAGVLDTLVDEIREAITAGGSPLRAKVLPPSVLPSSMPSLRIGRSGASVPSTADPTGGAGSSGPVGDAGADARDPAGSRLR